MRRRDRPRTQRWVSWLLSVGGGRVPDGPRLTSITECLSWARRLTRVRKYRLLLSQPLRSVGQTYDGARALAIIERNESALYDESVVQAGLFCADIVMQFGNFEVLSACVQPLLVYTEANRLSHLGVDSALVLAGVLREAGHLGAARAVLELVAAPARSLSPAPRVSYLTSVANLGKDLARSQADFQVVERQYTLAHAIAQAEEPRLLASVEHQLGMYHAERQDLERATVWIDRAMYTLGAHSGGYVGQRLLTGSMQIRLATARGDASEAIALARQLLEGLPEPPRYHDEATLHDAVADIARHRHAHALWLWAGRLAHAAVLLGGRSREVSAVLASLALPLAFTDTWSLEADYLLGLAAKKVDAYEEEIQRSGVLTNTAVLLWSRGRFTEAWERCTDALDLLDQMEQGGRNCVLTAGQHAIFAHFSGQVSNGLALLDAAEPDADPETLTLIVRFRAVLEMLRVGPNVLLDLPDQMAQATEGDSDDSCMGQFLEQICLTANLRSAHFTELPTSFAPRSYVMLAEYTRLSEEGYLGFVAYHLYLPPRRALEWILESEADTQLACAAFAEWTSLSRGGTSRHERGGARQHSAAQLRAAVARLQFDKERVLSPLDFDGTIPERSQSLAFNSLAATYLKSRTLYEVTLNDITPDYPEPLYGQDVLNDARNSEEDRRPLLTRPIIRFVDRWSSLGSRANQARIAELVQGRGQAWWLLWAPSQASLPGETCVVSVDISAGRAAAMTTAINRVVLAQQPDIPGALLEPYGNDLERLLEPVHGFIVEGGELYLGLSAPWNEIPIENLRSHSAHSLNDRVRCTRLVESVPLDACEEFVRDATEVLIVADSICDEGRLPGASAEAFTLARRCGSCARVGPSATRAAIEQHAPSAALIHIATHARTLEAPARMPALLLSDDYLLGPELAALDLSRCRVMILAVCNPGLSRRERRFAFDARHLATWALAAGVRSVVSPAGAIDDLQTRRFIERLHDGLLDGHAIGDAFGAALATMSREWFCPTPFVLWGATDTKLPAELTHSMADELDDDTC